MSIASKELSKIYESNDDSTNTLEYLLTYRSAQDSLGNNLNTMKAFQNETNNEIAFQSKKDTLKYNRTLLLIIAASGILLLIVLLYFRKKFNFKGKEKVNKIIKYVGIVSLILIIESLILMYHPFIHYITGHNALYMLILIAVLSPFLFFAHRKFDDYVSEKTNKQKRPFQKSQPPRVPRK